MNFRKEFVQSAREAFTIAKGGSESAEIFKPIDVAKFCNELRLSKISPLWFS